MRVTQLAMMIGLVAACAAGVETYTWDAGGDGSSWTDAANWDLGSGYPSNNTHAVVITNGNAAITVPAGTTLGALTLDAAYTGTVNLAGSLVIDAAGGASGNLTVNSGMLWTGKDVDSGITVAGTLLIASNATLVARRRDTAGDGTGQTIQVQDLMIDEGGVLHADGEGFDAGLNQGPGGPSHNYDGAPHGGNGGDNAAYGLFRDTYGSFTNPVALGSGAKGSPGGGAVVLVADGTVSVNGLISADGTITVNDDYGSGSGGSINVTAATLTGTGVIRACGGGAPRADKSGAGGGGRIAFNGITNDNFTGQILASAGTGAKFPGRPGTIWLSAPRRQNLFLGSGSMSNLVLGYDGTNDYTFGEVTIGENAMLEIDAYEDGSPNAGRAPTLYLDSLSVQSNGVLSASERGYRPSAGPGRPNHQYDGAAHGGVGGNNLQYGAVMAETYGSLTNPVTLGSGGNSYGGGAVIVAAAGSVTVDGTIAADSGNDTSSNGTGAGGSINILTPILAGSGILRASSGTTLRGTGGGGRIALRGVTNDTFCGTIEVLPGVSSENQHGRTGTIWLSEPRRQNLYLGAGGIAHLRLGSDGTNDYTFGSVVIGDGGLLELDSYVYTDEIGNAGVTNALGRVAVLHVDSLVVHSNGVLSAKGLGFLDMFVKWGVGAWGPGFAGTREHGAAHGGMGGSGFGDTTAGTLRPPYGSIANPVTLGSGAASKPGGALTIVANSVQVDGVITADADHAVTYGGGSGGSVNITAGSLTGTGAIRASGGMRGSRNNNGSGGGGRIAIVLTNSTGLGGVGLEAYGGGRVEYGAAGTCYIYTPDDPPDGGRVVYNNNGYATRTNSFSVFPGEDDLPKARVVVTNAGTRVNLSADARCQELTLDAGVVFNLNGRTLQTDRLMIDGSRYPASTYAASALPAEVIDEEAGAGRIVVLGNRAGTMILVR